MATGGWDHVTQSDAERMNRARTPTLRPVKADLRTDVPAVTRTRSKYRNVPTTVAGIRFDSAKEANRYLYLKNLEDIGGIKLLQLQTRWEIYIDGRDGSRRHIANWLSDFDYWTVPTEGRPTEHVVEDTKGFRTKEYLLKKKLIESIHGIRIQEL